MKDTPSPRIMLATAFFGAMTLVLALIMLFTFPSTANLSEGFQTPIIAFEFAKTESDVAFLSGMSEASVSNREKMDAGHFWDMFFPFAYGGFLALWMVKLQRQGIRFLKFGVLIALAIVPFDIYENVVLLDITAALGRASSVDMLLADLHIATWLKWSAIGLSAGMLAIGFTLQKHYFSAATSYLASLGILVCWLSDEQPTITELMSILTFVFFLWLAIKQFSETFKLIRDKGASVVADR